MATRRERQQQRDDRDLALGRTVKHRGILTSTVMSGPETSDNPFRDAIERMRDMSVEELTKNAHFEMAASELAQSVDGATLCATRASAYAGLAVLKSMQQQESPVS